MFDKYEALGLGGNPVCYTPGIISLGMKEVGEGAKQVPLKCCLLWPKQSSYPQSQKVTTALKTRWVFKVRDPHFPHLRCRKLEAKSSWFTEAQLRPRILNIRHQRGSRLKPSPGPSCRDHTVQPLEFFGLKKKTANLAAGGQPAESEGGAPSDAEER